MKCYKCKKEFEELFTFSSKKYCKKCYGVKKQAEKDRQILISYINQIFDIKNPTGLMFGQIKNFYNSGISYKNQALTLQYLIKVEKAELDKKYGIALVKHKHEEMIDYYKNKQERDESVKVINYNTLKIQVEDVKSKNIFNKVKLINMDNLLSKEE